MRRTVLAGVLILGGLAVLAGSRAGRWPGGSKATSLPPGTPPPAIPLSLPGVIKGATAGTARAAVVIDAATGELLYEHNAFAPYPIASLTKLAAAMVVLDRQPPLDHAVTVLPTEYTFRGGNLRLAPGETVTLADLLRAGVAGSANNAAFALPRSVGLSDEEFSRAMGRKAISLGLESLRFADAAGFGPANVGSAYDVARMSAEALRRYPLIAEAARAREIPLAIHGSVLGAREHVIRHSNKFLSEFGPGAASKTGYLDEALFCLMVARTLGDREVVGVILGHPSEIGVVQDMHALFARVEERISASPTPAVQPVP